MAVTAVSQAGDAAALAGARHWNAELNAVLRQSRRQIKMCLKSIIINIIYSRNDNRIDSRYAVY